MILSKQNAKIQRLRTLLERRKDRYEQKAFVLEGVRLIEEAIHTGALPELLLYSETSKRILDLVEIARSSGVETEQVSPDLLSNISDTQASQGLTAIFPFPTPPVPGLLDFVLILDAISDPGNLGAILRTAAAGGVQTVILTPGTTDPYAPKVVRAGMGAHFFLPILSLDWQDIDLFKRQSSPVLNFLASDVQGGKSCWQSDLTQPIGLIIGNEASGISDQACKAADDLIHIPMQGKIESLNASIAASILIFEVIRQRQS
jgi:TrmH family RNA methyltransferase